MRVLAATDDIAVETGARSTAHWLADQTRDAHAAVRRAAVLADAVDARWRLVGDRLATGSVNVAQARVMVEALDALPSGLGDDLPVKAEAYLVEKAATLGPKELRVLGRGVLDHLAPEVADEAEYQRLGSPTTSPAGYGATSTRTRPRDAPPWVRSMHCPSLGAVVRRSAPCWRTSSAPAFRPWRDRDLGDGHPRPRPADHRPRRRQDLGRGPDHRRAGQEGMRCAASAPGREVGSPHGEEQELRHLTGREVVVAHDQQ